MLVACRPAGLSALEAHYAASTARRDRTKRYQVAASPRTASDTQTLAGTHWSVANEIEQHDQKPSRDDQMPAACCVVGIWITVKDYCSERAVARPREGGRRLRRPN